MELGETRKKTRGGFPVETRVKFERVAKRLPADARSMKVFGRRMHIQFVRAFQERTSALENEIRRDDDRRETRRRRARTRASAQRTGRAFKEALGSKGIKETAKSFSRANATRFESTREIFPPFLIFRRRVLRFASKPFDLHVEITRVAGSAHERAKRRIQMCHSRREKISAESNRGAKPTKSDAKVVKRLGIFGETRARFARPGDPQLAPHRREKNLAHRRKRRGDGRAEIEVAEVFETRAAKRVFFRRRRGFLEGAVAFHRANEREDFRFARVERSENDRINRRRGRIGTREFRGLECQPGEREAEAKKCVRSAIPSRLENGMRRSSTEESARADFIVVFSRALDTRLSRRAPPVKGSEANGIRGCAAHLYEGESRATKPSVHRVEIGLFDSFRRLFADLKTA